jgi:hypothetical protein
MAALPALFVTQVWLTYKLGIQCTVNKRGIMRSFGDRARHYFWKDFKSYRFADYPLVPNVRGFDDYGASGKLAV